MKNTILYTIVFLSINISSLSAQEPDTLWTKRYGGNEIDVAYDIEEL